MIKTKKNNNKKISIVIVITVLLLVSILAVRFYSNRTVTPPKPSTQNINYNPPTNTEKVETDSNKQSVVDHDKVETTTNNNGPTTTKNMVKPIITYAGQYDAQVEVGGYVSVFEEGGNCTAKFINGNTIITKSAAAVKNAQSTDCPALIAKNEEFKVKGSWSVTLSYDSPKTYGTSDAKVIEIK